jgi:membrane protease YdiL (CAAX protease family)
MALVTLVGFSAVAFIIIVFIQGRSITDVLNQEIRSYPDQLWRGLVFGATASLSILWLLYNSILEESRTFFVQLIQNFKINFFDIFFVSFCAGVGEELLFRGALQYWFGIWPTAFIFIALHGYISLTDWRMTVYGLLMVIISAGFGYLYVNSGMLAAMSAHFLIDVVIFICLKYYNKNLNH